MEKIDWETIPKEEVDWNDVFFIYFDKPERFRALYKIRHSLPHAQFWSIFRSVWINSESHYDNRKEIKKMVSEFFFDSQSRQLFKDAVLEAEEDELLRSVPYGKTLTIYRGCWAKNRQGYSWTLNSDIAERFAKRHAPDDKPIVIKAECYPSEVIAYFNSRGEEEIVIPFEHTVRRRDLYVLPAGGDRTGAMIFQKAQSGTLFPREVDIHLKAGLLKLPNGPQYLLWVKDKLAFYKRFGFQEQFNFWNDVLITAQKDGIDVGQISGFR